MYIREKMRNKSKWEVKEKKINKRITAFYSDHRACCTTTSPPVTSIPSSLPPPPTCLSLRLPSRRALLENHPYPSPRHSPPNTTTVSRKSHGINYNTRRTIIYTVHARCSWLQRDEEKTYPGIGLKLLLHHPDCVDDDDDDANITEHNVVDDSTCTTTTRKPFVIIIIMITNYYLFIFFLRCIHEILQHENNNNNIIITASNERVLKSGTVCPRYHFQPNSRFTPVS